MLKKLWTILILFAGTLPAVGQSSFYKYPVTVMSYNVENFFHPSVDSLNPDREYTPKGSHRWTYARFNRKAEQIARVIANSMPELFPDVVVLNEIENDSCLIRLCQKMPHYPYGSIHFDSPDKRGIDVAVLYDSIRLQVISTCPIHVDLAQTTTRDIVYAAFEVDGRDTLHLIACHLPSQLGGSESSQWKRDSAKTAIRHLCDSIFDTSATARVIVCGDMNMPPQDDLRPMHNLMLPLVRADKGTHKFHGTWTCLDQFYISDMLLDESQASILDTPWLMEEDRRYLSVRPKRTFNGFRYNRNGFSDHLPILLTINFK